MNETNMNAKVERIAECFSQAIRELKSLEKENHKLAREWSEHGDIDTARVMIARARGCRDAINILTRMEKPI